jgi:hypothetical protein
MADEKLGKNWEIEMADEKFRKKWEIEIDENLRKKLKNWNGRWKI